MDVKKPIKSSMVKMGKRNFFFDVYIASNSKKYLKITESRVPEVEGEKGKRSSFILFPEDVQSFHTTLSEMVGAIG